MPHSSRVTGLIRAAAAPGGCAREFALDLLALLWPAACVGCGYPDRDLCAACTAQIQSHGSDGSRIDGLGVLGYAAGPYEGPLREALLAYKHRGSFGLRRLLGATLVAPLQRALAAASEMQRVDRSDPGAVPLLVAVPSRAPRVRERGFKHVDELVRVALRVGALPGVPRKALRTLRGRTGQVGLDAASRRRNAELIAVRSRAVKSLRGRTVILVDDIVTTGATIRAAIGVLEACGARVVATVALCSATRRDAPQKTEWNLTGERG